MVGALQDGAGAAECDLDITSQCLFHGYRTDPGAPAVRAAEAALRECGFTPRHIVTGGGSDANALQTRGLECVNLANGTERNHEPTERVSIAALEDALDVALALPAAAAAILAA
jgi:tripeptide aminopeptidase